MLLQARVQAIVSSWSAPRAASLEGVQTLHLLITICSMAVTMWKSPGPDQSSMTSPQI